MSKEAAMLRTWWLGCTVDARNLLTREESLSHHGRAALSRARKFLVDSDLEDWVDTQNVTKGITPHSTVVLEKSHKLCIEHHVPLKGRKRKTCFPVAPSLASPMGCACLNPASQRDAPGVTAAGEGPADITRAGVEKRGIGAGAKPDSARSGDKKGGHFQAPFWGPFLRGL